jgi:hypothetical protein
MILLIIIPVWWCRYDLNLIYVYWKKKFKVFNLYIYKVLPFSHVSPTRRPNMSAKISFWCASGTLDFSTGSCSFHGSAWNNGDEQRMESCISVPWKVLLLHLFRKPEHFAPLYSSLPTENAQSEKNKLGRHLTNVTYNVL